MKQRPKTCYEREKSIWYKTCLKMFDEKKDTVWLIETCHKLLKTIVHLN